MPLDHEGVLAYLATLKRKSQEGAERARERATFAPKDVEKVAAEIRAAHPAPPAAAPNSAARSTFQGTRARTRETHLFRCDACGQVWRIEYAAGVLNERPFQLWQCPAGCVGGALTNVPHSFGALDAPCFNGWPRPLLELLFQEWRSGGKYEPRNYARFIDYIQHVVKVIERLIP